MTIKPGTTLDKYRIVDQIGLGGMGVVYRATHVSLQSNHAIKVLKTEYLENPNIRNRFLQEGRIQAGLQHPHITPVTDLISAPGVAALVMPLLSGQDLADRLQQGPIPIKTAVTWCRQALSALAYVHGENIIHRDLKPANIFLAQQPDGTVVVRLMDFGIARVIGMDRTRPGIRMGTPNYMSPEQIRTPETVDARSDVFAMGAILYEMLTGRLAFEADNEHDTEALILNGDYPRIHDRNPTVPWPLCGVVEAALQVDPEQRLDSATSFRDSLSLAMTQAPHTKGDASGRYRDSDRIPQAPHTKGDALYKRGNTAYTEGNHADAAAYFRRAAQQGVAQAQYSLGMMLLHGRGVDQNDAEAARWHRSAAEQGFARAQFILGALYERGRGVEQSDVEAVRWYQQAAEQGQSSAQHNLGVMMYEGRGTERGDEKAAQWTRRAAEQGRADAQCQLGILYYLGQGVEQSDTEAVQWLQRAAAQGQEQAKELLEQIQKTRASKKSWWPF